MAKKMPQSPFTLTDRGKPPLERLARRSAQKRLTLGMIFCVIALFWLGSLAPAQDGKNPLTNEDFQRIARKYLEAWGVEPGAPFIWVILAMPNASVPLNIPGITFGHEGMSVLA
jgi:hypothetical protein